MTSSIVEQPMGELFFPYVSVIVPIYNGEEDVPELLDGLKAQTYPSDRVEYLLVDNGSGDRTVPLLQAAAQESLTWGLTIRFLQETQIQSSYAARNTGIRSAKGDILAFTDADCRPQPNWLSELIQPFADESVGLVAGEVMALSGSSILEQFADRHETLSQKHTLAHPFCPYGQTANLAIRRQALVEAGLFRPYLTTGGDADICWRIQKQGTWKIYFAEQATVQHRHRSTLSELRKQWQRYGKSNRYLHELYGVSLMRELTLKDYVHRWSRWLLKDVPTTVRKIVSHHADVSTLVDTPLDLLCSQWRSQGQRAAQLPDQARQIEWLTPSPDVPAQALDG